LKVDSCIGLRVRALWIDPRETGDDIEVAVAVEIGELEVKDAGARDERLRRDDGDLRICAAGACPACFTETLCLWVGAVEVDAGAVDGRVGWL
jgi:hypothetical protein